MKRKVVIEWVVLISVILIFAYTGWHKPLIVQLQRAMIYTGLFSPDTSKPVVTNHGVYDMVIRDEAGKIVPLSKFAGKLVFLNLWATWCPPCRAEMPGINKLYSKVDSAEVAFVILTTEQDFEKAKSYKADNNFNFPIYQLASPLPSIYQENSIPRSYLINQKGELVMKHTGLADYDSKKFIIFLEEQTGLN